MNNRNKSSFNYDDFKQYFISNGFIGDEVVKQLYVVLTTSIKAGTVPALLLRGPPGTGKTWITYLTAKYFDANYVFYQATLNTTEDDLMYKYMPSETTKSGIKIMPGSLAEALIKSRKKPTVLVIDEFDKTRPSADALLLDYLQNARVSVRINDENAIIEGDRRNLIVFITSNDFREFSEPLLRRVSVITFKYLPTSEIRRLLKRNGFDDKIVEILVKLYNITINGQFSKAATVQELLQLGTAMAIDSDANFLELVKTFVIKNDDDYKTFLENYHNSDLYNDVGDNNHDNIDIDEIAKNVNNNVPQAQAQQAQPVEQTVQQILSKILVPTQNIVKTVDNVEEANDKTEVTFSASVNDFREYSKIITTFKPEPGDRPDVIGRFKLLLDSTTLKLTSDKPLTLDEILQIHSQMKLEAYVEEYVYGITYNKLIEMITEHYSNLTIVYYTKDLIVARHGGDTPYFILRNEKVNGGLYKVKIYVNNCTDNDKQDALLSALRRFTLDRVYAELADNVCESIISTNNINNDKNFVRLKNFINDVRAIMPFEAKATILLSDRTSSAYVSTFKSYYNIELDTEPKFKNGVIELKFSNVIVKYLVSDDAPVNVRDYKEDITSKIREITGKYAGEYDVIDGLIAYSTMLNEIRTYAKAKFDELVQKFGEWHA